VRPPLAGMMFVAQRTYLALGSPRDQLCYPHVNGVTDAALLAIVRQIKLDDAPERCMRVRICVYEGRATILNRGSSGEWQFAWMNWF
jgi:ABC-type uncharacterized transport system fused permease/ATPase subunit